MEPSETAGSLQVVFFVLQGFMTLVIAGAIPWAFKVVRELGEIGKTLESREWQADAITGIKEDIGSIQVGMARMGNGRK